MKQGVPPMENPPNVFNSKEALIAKQFAQRYIKKGKVTEEILLDEKLLTAFLTENELVKEGNSTKDVIVSLREMGVLPEKVVVAPEAKKIEKNKPEFIPVAIPKKEGLRIVHDEQLEQNLSDLHKQFEKDALFEDPAELDAVYTEALALEKNREEETPDYYYAFTEVGYTKEEIEKDLGKLKEREEMFANKSLQHPEKYQEMEKNKKIATVAEIGLEYGVSELGWYGKNVTIEPTSKFDDIKRRVDGLLKIENFNNEIKFLGLGIDVTYRGLHSEQYKEKFFTLLQSIKDGYKTKVKYLKQHNGTLVKEFAVPKIIIYLNFGDVKNLAYMMKHINDPGMREQFKNHPQKFAVMNQVITQCEKLGAFAEECGNSIADGYKDMLSAIEVLGREYPEIQAMLDVRHEDKTSLHLNELIQEFKTLHHKRAA